MTFFFLFGSRWWLRQYIIHSACVFSLWKLLDIFRDTYHRPLCHFNIKAETLVDGVRFSPNAGLELEHLWLIYDKTILKINTLVINSLKIQWKMIMEWKWIYLQLQMHGSASLKWLICMLCVCCERHRRYFETRRFMYPECPVLLWKYDWKYRKKRKTNEKKLNHRQQQKQNIYHCGLDLQNSFFVVLLVFFFLVVQTF